MTRVAVLGAGSWGTALAVLLARQGHAVTLWGRDREQVSRMRSRRENRRYLPGIRFPDALDPCPDLEPAVADARIVVVAVPSHAFAEQVQALADSAWAGSGVVWATKGFDPSSGGLLHTCARDRLGPEVPLAVLSGPTFAGEVAAGLPTAVTVASSSPEFAAECAALFHGPEFRVYTSDDMAGVEVAGAVKNVLAIAAGMVDGLGFGANARAALVTRGLVELMRLGVALGGRTETFMGLSGLGDLMLTCTDDQSRNRRFGLALAAGAGPEEAARQVGQVVEGARACDLVQAIARREGVDMPICTQVYDILHRGVAPAEAARKLLAREPKPEGA